MTRLFKMSLGLVALLILTMLVLTGCGHAELEEGIDEAQNAANEAQAGVDANETKLTEAKQSIVDATAALEAAIAKKADSTTLATKVTELTAAVEAAKAASSAADGALKVELDAAIAAAKATIMAEAENLVRELDAEIIALVNDKASAAALQSEVARLEKLIADMKVITDNAMDGNAFRNLTNSVAAYRLVLANLHEQYLSTGLYNNAEAYQKILLAYMTADTKLVRAQSAAELKPALDDYRNVFLEDGVASVIDELYIRIVAAENDSTFPIKGENGIIAICNLAADYVDPTSVIYDETLAELVLEYYDGTNLLRRAILAYGDLLNPVLSELGDRFIVPVGVSQEADAEAGLIAISGDKDLADLEAAFELGQTLSDLVDRYDDVMTAQGLYTDIFFGDVFNEIVLAKYEFNYNRAYALKAALDVKAQVEALDKGYNDGEGFPEIALLQSVVDDITVWKNAVEDWNIRFNSITVGESATEETKQRKALVDAIIADTEAKMNEDLATLMALADAFKADAFTFQQLVSEFYTLPADKAEDLFLGSLDLNKVTLASGTTIRAAFEAYDALIIKYPVGVGVIDGIIYSGNDKKVFDSYEELTLIAKKYFAYVDAAIGAWDQEAFDETKDLTVDDITIYNTSVAKVLAWFEGDYIPVVDGEIVWDTVDGEPAYNLYREATPDENLVITKEYYERLMALADKLEELIDAKNEAAVALRAEILALFGNPADITAVDGNIIKLSQFDAVNAAVESWNAYLAVGTPSEYEADNALNTDAASGRDFLIDPALIAALEAADKRVDELQKLYDAIVAKAEELDAKAAEAINADTNIFNTPELETAYIALKDELKGLINDFVTLDAQNKGDDEYNETNLAAANASLLTAQQNIAKDEIYTELAKLTALNAKLGEMTAYFADATTETEVARADYEAALKAVVDVLNGLSANCDGIKASTLGLTDVEDAVEAAKRVLALDNVYQAFAALEEKKPTATAYPYFEDAAARDAYSALIDAVEAAIAAGYTVEGYPVEGGYCDAKYTLAADDADIAAVVAAVNAAKELVARDIVEEKLDDLKDITDGNSYPYFENEAEKDAYENATEDLKEALDNYDKVIEETGLEENENVTDAKAEVADAADKIAKYESFESYYRALLNAALANVDAAADKTPDEKATIKEEVNTVFRGQFEAFVPEWTLDDINNAERKGTVVTLLNQVLAKYDVALISAE